MKLSAQIIFFLLFLYGFSVKAQQTYRNSYSFPEKIFFNESIKETNADSIILTGFLLDDAFNFEAFTFFLDEEGDISSCLKVYSVENGEPDPGVSDDITTDNSHNTYFILGRYLSKVNSTNEVEWTRQLRGGGGDITTNEYPTIDASLYFSSTGNIVSASGHRAGINFSVFSQTGEELFSNKIQSYIPGTEEFFKKGVIKDCRQLLNGNALISGTYKVIDDPYVESFFIEIDMLGNIINTFVTPNKFYEVADLFSNGDILMLRSFYIEGQDTEFDIARITLSGEVVYNKRIDLQNSGAFGGKVGLTSTDEIVVSISSFSSSTFGLIKLDENCEEVIWAKSYPKAPPISDNLNLKILESDNIFVYIRIINDNFDSSILLTKTDSEGNLEGYSPDIFCIETPTDAPLEFIERTYTTATLENTLSMELAVVNYPWNEEPLQFPENPDPNFNFPSQVCITDCAEATDLNNANAQTVTWTVENGAPATSQEAEPGQICFDTPGTHTIRQTITFNNCAYSFEREVEVIAEPEFELDSIQTLCEQGETLRLSAQVSEEANYAWSTGELTSEIEVNEMGIYSVTVSNEVCETSDTILINAINPEPHPISLPQDTIVCRQHLPFVITPNFAATEDIIWQDGRVLPDFTVTQEGIYTATIEVEDCSFSADIEIDIEDCSERIYIPNVFSPDNDGVNDVFRAEGRDFIVTQMLIYDRWGSLIFQANTFDAAWDGRHKGDFVGRGVFVYVISYQNTLLGVEETVSGDVLVLK